MVPPRCAASSVASADTLMSWRQKPDCAGGSLGQRGHMDRPQRSGLPRSGTAVVPRGAHAVAFTAVGCTAGAYTIEVAFTIVVAFTIAAAGFVAERADCGRPESELLR